MNITIICPLYNCVKYIESLNSNLKNQEKYNDEKVYIRYELTESTDGSEELLKKLNIDYNLVKKEEFSHSLTREKAAMSSEGDIIVFISQDVKMVNKLWLKNLIGPIIDNECEASFSRQICENNSIEKYIREKNYPKVSRVVSKNDIEKYGLLTFFYSDASSAIKTSVYKELKGYDGKDLIINEDMYIAYKIINNGYRIKYCSDSEVFHSHIFTLKSLYERYFDTGVFFKENPQFLNYNGNGSGKVLAIHCFKRALEERNIKVLINLLPNFASRFIGSTLGKKYDKLPGKFVRYSSMSKKYWTK